MVAYDAAETIEREPPQNPFRLRTYGGLVDPEIGTYSATADGRFPTIREDVNYRRKINLVSDRFPELTERIDAMTDTLISL